MILIGISGKLGSGKDTIAKFLPDAMPSKGLRVTYMAFADHIKVSVASRLGRNIMDFYDRKEPSDRKLLQEEGTENGRDKYGDDIWVNTLWNWSIVRAMRDGVDVIIVTDCRFPNEAEFIETHGGLVIRIDAPDRNELALQKESKGDVSAYNSISCHQSETALDDYAFKYRINNTIAAQATVMSQITPIITEFLSATAH